MISIWTTNIYCKDIKEKEKAIERIKYSSAYKPKRFYCMHIRRGGIIPQIKKQSYTFHLARDQEKFTTIYWTVGQKKLQKIQTWMSSESSPESSLKAISGFWSLFEMKYSATSSSIKSAASLSLTTIRWRSIKIEGSHIVHEYFSNNCTANKYSHRVFMSEIE